MLVHGQIILNQFKNYPVKAIQQCAFVSALQTRMSERKHSKLFMSKRKFTANMRIAKKVNPMRNRDPKPKPKPMTATATTLVKAIWADYFCAGAAKAGELSAARSRLPSCMWKAWECCEVWELKTYVNAPSCSD